jgi:hypothetical protein
MALDIISTTEEKVPIFVNPKTAKGKPAPIDGLAVLSIVSGGATTAAATEQEIADSNAAGLPGLVGFVISEDVPGTSAWQVTADTDLGAGITTIVDGSTYVYNDPQASNLGATAGTPVLK